MTAAFFHGLESPAVSDKTKFLEESFSTVFAPPMDYKDFTLFEKTLEQIETLKPDVLIGSSMGGYFAYFISTLTGIPTIQFNPATNNRPIETPVRTGTLMANHIIILGQKDKVINPQTTLQWYKENGLGNFSFNWEGNAHRTPIDIFQKYVKSFISANPSELLKSSSDSHQINEWILGSQNKENKL